MAAGIGVLAVTASSYVIEKFKSAATRPLYFLPVLPAAVPGMVGAGRGANPDGDPKQPPVRSRFDGITRDSVAKDG